MIREPNVHDVMRYIVGFVVAVVNNDDVPYELRIQGLEELRNLARLLPDEVDNLRHAYATVGLWGDIAKSLAKYVTEETDGVRFNLDLVREADDADAET
jgi:hypothetical protein